MNAMINTDKIDIPNPTNKPDFLQPNITTYDLLPFYFFYLPSLKFFRKGFSYL